MKQQLRVPVSDKLYNIIVLIFCFGTPSYMPDKFGSENKTLLLTVFLFSTGIYGLFKIYRNSKSVFVQCNLDETNKKLSINKLAEEKYIKTLPSLNPAIVILNYKKYTLGLDYEIQFYLHENEIEFNAFCNQLGIIDFGIRRRIIREIKSRIESSCACL